MKMSASGIRIISCEAPTELYRHYEGQTGAQPVYIALDLRDATLFAVYNAEVGNALPKNVFHGFERRYPIPVLTAQAANGLMAELRPLAERIVGDWQELWDGHNMVARLGPDALAAEAELQARLGLGTDEFNTYAFDEADLVAQWDIDGALNGQEVAEFGIIADTSDERLDAIEGDIIAALAGDGNGTAVVHGLKAHLRALRDELTSAKD
ncbi:hypothetical protein PJN29_24105 [Mycobacterium kansasii]